VLEKSVVDAVEGLFLIETYNSGQELFEFSIINDVTQQEKVFENITPRHATGLILTENLGENLA